MGRKANPNKVVRTNTIPSLESERKELRGMIREAVDAKLMIHSQNEKFNEIRAEILEKFAITGKLMNNLINFEYKQDFDRRSAEQNEIFEAYEQLKASKP